jgi:hypothetical protein
MARTYTFLYDVRLRKEADPFVVGFDVLTAMVMKSTIFWDIRPCSPLKVKRRFGGTCGSACRLLHAGFLLGLLFDPEDGEDIFLQNVG